MKKRKAPVVCTIFALIGATGQVIGLSAADAIPEGTTYLCRVGDKEWHEVAQTNQSPVTISPR